jgi:hypothetical protein
MHFWRIEELKNKLKEKPLTEREALPYFLIYSALTTLVSILPTEETNFWDYVDVVSALIVTLAGTVYTFRCNGGTEGSHFLQRYFAIGWVVVLRWGVVVFPLFILVLGVTEETTWHDAVYFGVAAIVYYQRLGHHMRDVAASTSLNKAGDLRKFD